MDLGNWLRSRQEDVVDNVFKPTRRLLDILGGPGGQPVQSDRKVTGIKDLTNINRPDRRLNYLSGDQQLNNTKNKQGNLFEGLQMNGRPMGYGYDPVKMPTFYLPGTRFQQMEDGTRRAVEPIIDGKVFVDPRQKVTKPQIYEDKLYNFRGSI